MFRKHLISFALIWFLLVLSYFGLFYAFSDAHEDYQQLMSQSSSMKKEHLYEKVCPIKQMRHHVSKQILYKKGGHRMQTRLASDYSDLIYSKSEGELIERFKGLTCIMQEEWMEAPLRDSEPMKQQIIRQFTAQEAHYSYKTGQLQAQEVQLARYLLPGHHWPDSLTLSHPLLQGHAATLHLSLFEEPSLKAQQFQVTFHNWEND